MQEKEQEVAVWVCRVKHRSYDHPTNKLEYRCFGTANGKVFMQREHKEAGCGLYTRVS